MPGTSESRFVSLPLLGRRPIWLALASQAANRAGYFAILFVLALYPHQGLGKSATYSGLVPVAWVATFALVGPVLGRTGPRTRRLAAPVGGLLIAVSFAGLAVLAGSRVDGDLWLVLLLGAGGIGYGAAFSGVLTHLTDSAEPRHAPDVSGLFNTTLQVGRTLGIAVFGTVYLNLTRRDRVPQDAFAVTTATLACVSVLTAVLIRAAGRHDATA